MMAYNAGADIGEQNRMGKTERTERGRGRRKKTKEKIAEKEVLQAVMEKSIFQQGLIVIPHCQHSFCSTTCATQEEKK